ncbi:MAG: hypothetical protein ACKO4N_02280 [Verrucomicrobiota bacterium]
MRPPLTACLVACCAACFAAPTFEAPGQEAEMRTLEAMNALHAVRSGGYADCTLWDRWMPHALLWQSESTAKGYRASLLRKRIDHEGYVSMQQHRGMAHGDGWPFPAWQQSTGKGFHFSTLHEVWAVQIFGLKPLTDAAGFEITGAETIGIDPEHGLRLRATGEVVTVATPAFRCGTVVAPFARVEWSALGLPEAAKPTVSWRYDGEQGWDESRAAPFPPRGDVTKTDFSHVPLYKERGYGGLLAGLRLRFPATKGAVLRIKSVMTSVDTRHPITNANFLEGCADTFAWTGDVEFLRENLGRMRKALEWSLREFQVRELGRVRVSWVGHDGSSGLTRGPDGALLPRIGLGVGNNYWDLIPFGGEDALATVYQWHAIRRMAEIEAWVASRRDAALPAPAPRLGAEDLRKLADDVRARAGEFFWDAAKGRLIGWRDLTGQAHDYGFVFLNEEAIALGFTTDAQSRAIMDWIDGRRTVEGDTSQGADIFHWRFGPRMTTRRNVDDYVWVWSRPDSIPWGGQVQDGGGVLGFSYHDVMARLRVNGPDDAWRRLKEINAWFRETQAEGGYRAFYAKPGRGTMQGGGLAGGLGLDQEFFESALVPTVLVHGFLGLKAGPDGLKAEPRLPKGWPSLTVRGVLHGGATYDVTGRADGTSEIVRR